MLGATAVGPLLQVGGLLATPWGKLLVAIVALLVIVLVGRFVLSVATKILVLAGVVVAVLYVLSLFVSL